MSIPAVTLRKKLQLVQNGLLVFLYKWVELNECVGTVLNKGDQVGASTSLQRCFQKTDGQMQGNAELENLRKQIQSCVNTHDRLEKKPKVLFKLG